MSVKPITVTIDTSSFANPVHRGLAALAELKRVGVPIVGTLFPEGVTHGTLSIAAPDLVTGEVLYSWDASSTPFEAGSG